MSIADTWDKLSSIHSAISGVTVVSTAFPASLNSADLPLVLTIPGAAQWNPHAGERLGGLQRQVRTYTVNVYVQPVGQDIGPDYSAQTAMTLMQRFGATYITNWTLGGTIDKFNSVKDSGLRGDLTYAGQTYTGFTFYLEAVEKATST